MANGDIGACLDIERRPETIQGNILRDDFTDVWYNKFDIFRKPLSDKNEKCKNCKSCLKTGCPAIECVGKGAKPTINAMSCNGCGLCNQVCKFGAISE